MGVESATEVGLQTDIATAMGTAGVADVTYRRYWSNDSAGAATEPLTVPCVVITAAPNVPRGSGDPFRDIAVEIEIRTSIHDDPKRATLLKMYDAVRTVTDASPPQITISGYGAQGVQVQDGGSADVDDRHNVVTLPVAVYVCATA